MAYAAIPYFCVEIFPSLLYKYNKVLGAQGWEGMNYLESFIVGAIACLIVELIRSKIGKGKKHTINPKVSKIFKMIGLGILSFFSSEIALAVSLNGIEIKGPATIVIVLLFILLYILFMILYLHLYSKFIEKNQKEQE